MMKKSFYVAAMAGLIFSACSNETYLGGEAPEVKNDGAIGFGTKTGAITRANTGLESIANNFRVYGVKMYEGAAAPSVVFDNYKVVWADASAGKTASNTSDWEYVSADQTIKYWDYTAESYTFWGVSDKNDKVQFSSTDENSKVLLDNGVPNTLTIKEVTASDDEADIILYTFGQTVKRSDFNKPVVMKFRRMASKIRVGFYETVPGYKVSDLKFYKGDEVSASDHVVLNGTFVTEADYTLTYNDDLTVSSEASNPTSANSLDIAEGLNVVDADQVDVQTTDKYLLTAATTNCLKTTSAQPTYANHNDKTEYSSDQFMYVLPNEQQTNSMKIKVDFVLTSDDGKEQIKVSGATAEVPADYLKWAPNYAYTYLFKISDQVNGTTGQGQTATEKMEDLKTDFPKDPFNHESSADTYGQDEQGLTPDNEHYGEDENGKKPGEEGYTGSITDVDGFNKFKEDWIDAQKDDDHALYAITFDAVIEDVIDGQQGTVTTVSEPSITTYQAGSLVGDGIAYKAGEIEVKTNVTVKTLTVKNLTDNTEEVDILTAKKFTAEKGKKYQITATTEAGVSVTKLIEIPAE